MSTRQLIESMYARYGKRMGISRSDMKTLVYGMVGEDGFIADSLARSEDVRLPIGGLKVRSKIIAATYRDPRDGSVHPHPRAGGTDRNVTFKDGTALRRRMGEN